MKKLLLIKALFVVMLTQAQVSQVKDIYPGIPSSIPAYAKNRIVHAGKLIMAADGGAVYSTQLWESDGTSTGTVQLKRISSANTASNPQGFMYFAPTNKVYFSANNGVNSLGTTNYELWETDGTLAGTVMTKEINAFTSNPGGYPAELTAFGNNFYFRANNGTTGSELFVSDGTGAGTVLVSDINPGSAASTPADFTVVGTKLFFTADNGTSGKELYVTTGPTSATVSSFDINPGSASSGVDNLTFVDITGKLYFTANDGVHGTELWQSDGTPAGTFMVTDLNTGIADSAPADLFVRAGFLYFSATTPTYGRELYVMDASLNVFLFKDINLGPADGMTAGGANFISYTNVNTRLYFVANNGVDGAELWKSNGSPAGTVIVKDINPTGNSNITNMFVFDGKIVFQATNGASGAELFVSDGTDSGTGLAADINSGSAGSNPKDFIIYNSQLYFTATDVATGTELWKAATAPTLGTTELTLVNNKIRLYPNPAKNYFELTTNQPIEKVEIYSMLGQLVKTFSAQNKYETSDLSKANYIVKINTNTTFENKILVVE
ncbi:T9SS type A sorting domain-containing protein [Flavobacterium paronense]|uniref:ELWxxDGT repeat protein n=1 Tax=Flavobacterium paronense TaxID=1392775 RepID=A0ABV5GHG8_9FLAO|nr:ELWxxDGT repeat protein [Flavobacterium paronense]MDN3676438.1 T9SS type A sorting domain-containing protein [Flavobacterium paronense]